MAVGQRCGDAVAHSVGHRKETIAVLLSTLSSAFTGASIEHMHAEGCHRIRMMLPKVTHQLDFLNEVIARKDVS